MDWVPAGRDNDTYVPDQPPRQDWSASSAPPYRNGVPVLAVGLVLLLALGGLAWAVLYRPAYSPTPNTTSGSATSGSATSGSAASGSAASGSATSGGASSAPRDDNGPAPGDLGLSRAMSQPACEGQYVTFVGSVVTPGAYSSGIQRLLNTHPGASYLRSENGCASLRPRMPDGSSIYSVYYGPFESQADACEARARVGGGSYVKQLDNVTPTSVQVQC